MKRININRILKYALILSFLSITHVSFPQAVTIYIDEYRFPVKTREEASSYFVVTADTVPGQYRVNEFYLTDTLKESGSYSDADLFIRNGVFLSYYPNGTKKAEEAFAANHRFGVASFWYENGKLKEVRHYGKDDFRIESFFDSLGNPMVTEGNGDYIFKEEEQGTQAITFRGRVAKGLKHGIFTGYLADGTVYCKDEYSKGDFVKGVSFNNGKEYTYKSLEFDGFSERLMRHLVKNIRYPASARRMGVDGTVYVRMIIKDDYSIAKAMVRKSVSPDLDAEAVRVLVKTRFKFGPLVKRGQLYPMAVFTTPIKFKLN